jgi:hypothetical protein
MNNIMVPQVPVGWFPGTQITNLGEGGPASHMQLLAAAPRPYPFLVGNMSGLGAMPRQVLGPTPVVNSNQYSNPLTINNLEIVGLFKSPIATAI